MGVTARPQQTPPPGNAIGLSSPVGGLLSGAIGELSPWHSILPPRGAEGWPSAQGEGTEARLGLCEGLVAAVAVAGVLAASLANPALAAPPEPLAVEVTNASEPVLCAEKDNVTINLASKDVRHLRIEAAHPAYIGSLQRDSFEADWTGCNAAGDPRPAPRSRRAAPRSTRTSSCGWWASPSRPSGARPQPPCASASASPRASTSSRCG